MRRNAATRALVRLLRRAANYLSDDHRPLRDQLPQYTVGRGTYGRPEIIDYGEGATLRIGAFCSIGREVTIFLGGEHRTDWVTTFPFSALWPSARHIAGHPHTKGDVLIGSDVWIGYGATILSGTRIGDGAVVGARAVVRGVVEPYAVVAGNPARPVRKRFDDETIRRLQRIAWWDWPDAEIEAALKLLLSSDIATFLAYAEGRG